MAEISPLRRRMIEDMTVRKISPATQQSYVHAVSKFCCDPRGRMMIRIEHGKGGQGALRDAVGAAAGDPAHLLAAGAP
jgi:hypothetical protein